LTDPYQSHERPQDPAPGQFYPYPQPGYYMYVPPPPPPGMARPSSYLAWAIVSIFLFWPLAIPALIKSTQVDRLWAEGRYGLAQQASNTTKTLCLIATILGAALLVLWLVVFFVVASRFPSYPIR
jgi:hypothetical protein